MNSESVGILVSSDVEIKKALEYASDINRNNLSAIFFSDKKIVADIPCFSRSEIMFFNGTLVVFNASLLESFCNMKNIARIIWVPFVAKKIANQIVTIMRAKKDRRFKILFDESLDARNGVKEIFRTTMKSPDGIVNDRKKINEVIGELNEE